jgi:prepilin-type N-terminal cleavage/methylation domain-containing protein
MIRTAGPVAHGAGMHMPDGRRAPEGFSVVEFMVGVLILGVLAAIVAMFSIQIGSRAQTSVEWSNVRSIAATIDYVRSSSQGLTVAYRRSTRDPNDYAPDSLSTALEKYLEAGKPGTNTVRLMNPASKKGSVVNWDSVPDWPSMPPAVFITDSRPWATSGPEPRLAGTIVVNFNAQTGKIEVYYHDFQGRLVPDSIFVAGVL